MQNTFDMHTYQDARSIGVYKVELVIHNDIYTYIYKYLVYRENSETDSVIYYLKLL